MPGPFDTTTRYLVETYPADWLAYLDLGAVGPARVIDAGLTAVSAEVDKVVRVDGAPPWLAHLEFQSSYDPTIARRLLRYNAMLHLQHGLPVASVLVLLRPSANGPAIDGDYRVAFAPGQAYLMFRYTVRRLWRESPTDLLAGPLGTLPLAPLAATRRDDLPDMLRTMDGRFISEAPAAEGARLRVVTYTLLGLNFPSDIVNQLMPGLQNMRDSSTYQAILDEGRAEGRAEGRVDGERRLLLLLGTPRLGRADQATRSRLDAITDSDTLERLASRLLSASSWADLLADA